MKSVDLALLGRLRARAMNAKTASQRRYWMRAYLRNKARLGIWDTRMLNGYPATVNDATRQFIMRGVAAGLVCTSTARNNGGSSYHDQSPGMAADMGLEAHEVGTPKGLQKMANFQAKECRKRPERYLELIGPINKLQVKNGIVYALPEGNPLEDLHDNHVHGAARS